MAVCSLAERITHTHTDPLTDISDRIMLLADSWSRPLYSPHSLSI